MSFLGKLKGSKSLRAVEKPARPKDALKSSASTSSPSFLDVQGLRCFQDSEPDSGLDVENKLNAPPNITVQNPSPEPERFTAPSLAQLEITTAAKDSRIPLSKSLDSIPTFRFLRKNADCELVA